MSTIKQQIEEDLKAAMLAGDKTLVTTLRGLKSAILYVEVAKGARDTGVSDEEVTSLLAKESKKRQESADLYQQGGNTERATAELAEKEVIARYLPAQLDDAALEAIVDKAIAANGSSDMSAMGKIIAAVKQEVGSSVEGSRIATTVKRRLQ